MRSLVLLLALLVPAVALGDEGDPAVAAAERFEVGQRAFESGDYDQAVAAFEAAYALKPHPDLLINIATSYERIYQPDKARAYYQRFLHDAPPDETELRALAEKRLRVLVKLPGSILVDTNPAGATALLTDAAGHAQEATTPHRFEELLPGAYHLRVTLPDYGSVEEDVRLEPAESHVANVRLIHQVEAVTVFSNPDGARLFVNDREVGITPFSRPMEVGKLQLRLELPDYPPQLSTVDLALGKPVLERVKFRRPPNSGRTELVLFSMAFGGYAAGALTVAIGGNRVTVGNGLAILVPTAAAGVGLGFLAAWRLTNEQLKVGHSSVIIGSTIWGTSLGVSLGYGLGFTGPLGHRTAQQNTLALSLLGGSLGMGAGILSAWLADPSSGDAAIANSGGLWGTAVGALVTEAVDFRAAQHSRAFGWMTFGGTTLGLVGGALAAWGLDRSRSHMAIIDASGLVGLALGYGIGYAAGHDTPDPDGGTVCTGPTRRCVSGARYALGGLAIGIITSAILTRHFKYDLPKSEALVTRHDGHWALGLPRLRIGPGVTPEGTDQRAVLDLAHGEW